jgi:hypothetical protein
MLAGGGCGGSNKSSSSSPPDLPGEPADFADIAGGWDLSNLDAKADVAIDEDGVEAVEDMPDEDSDFIKALKGAYTALFEWDEIDEDPGDLTVTIPSGLWNEARENPVAEDYGVDYEDFTDGNGNQKPAAYSGRAQLYIDLEDGENEEEKLLTVELYGGEELGSVSDSLPSRIPLKRTAPGKFEIDHSGTNSGFGIEIKADLTIHKDAEIRELPDGTLVPGLSVLNILVNGTVTVSFGENRMGEVKLTNVVLRTLEYIGG